MIFLLTSLALAGTPEVDALAKAVQRGLGPDAVVSSIKGMAPLTPADVVELLQAGVTPATLRAAGYEPTASIPPSPDVPPAPVKTETPKAGAFGILEGTPVKSIPGAVPVAGAPNVYDLKVVPKPNSEFEFYSVVATANTGVCKVVGIGKDHDGDINGYDIRDTLSTFKGLLTAKYGESKTIDYIESGSIWGSGNGYFAMSLLKKERTLSVFWSADLPGATLPSGIDDISLDVRGSSSTATYMTLSYEFSNFDECSKAYVDIDNSGL